MEVFGWAQVNKSIIPSASQIVRGFFGKEFFGMQSFTGLQLILPVTDANCLAAATGVLDIAKLGFQGFSVWRRDEVNGVLYGWWKESPQSSADVDWSIVWQCEVELPLSMSVRKNIVDFLFIVRELYSFHGARQKVFMVTAQDSRRVLFLGPDDNVSDSLRVDPNGSIEWMLGVTA